MPQRNVASNFTFEQQRVEINNLAQDFWTQKGTVDTAASTYLKHDGTNNFTGATLAVPNAFTINSNSGGGTVTIAGNLDVTGTTTTVSTANLEVTDKNILIAKGSTSDAQADGAGITIDSGTDITFNFVDAKDALVSSIGLEGTTFLKAPYGQFTGSGTPGTGQGVEINAPDSTTGQIISYDRGGSAYKELRVKGSSVGIYGGTTNALVGTFNSTGLDVTGSLAVNSGTINTCATFTSTDAGAVINITDNSARSSIEQHGTDLKIISDTDAGNANSTIKFQVDASTKMTLDSSGNLDVTGTITASDDVTITGNKTLKIESSSTDDYIRIYAGGGTGKWDIYGNGANLRFSDNESAGSIVFDRNVDANGGLDVTGSLGISDTVPTLTLTDTDGGTCYHEIKGPGNGDLRISCDVGNTSSSASEIQFDIHDDNKMVIQSTGNVGIGTVSPSSNLHIASSLATIRLEDSDVANGASYSLITSSSNGNIELSADPDNVRSSSDIRFNVDGTERVRINADGKLQIDRTVSSTSGNHPALEIETISSGSEDTTFATGIDFKVDGVHKKRLAVTNGTGEGGGNWIFYRDNGVNQAMTIDSSGRVGIGTSSPTVTLDLESNTPVLKFTDANATGTPETEVSGAGGNLTLSADKDNEKADTAIICKCDGSTVISVTHNAQTEFEVGSTAKFQRNTGGTNSNAVLFNSAGNLVGKIIFNNTDTFYQTGSSDRTLKKNFENWTETILTSFKNLNPQKFNFTQEEDSETKHKGFIAQDLADKFPEAYPKDPETDKYGFNPSGMVVYLMKAIQELEAEVAALKAAE